MVPESGRWVFRFFSSTFRFCVSFIGGVSSRDSSLGFQKYRWKIQCLQSAPLWWACAVCDIDEPIKVMHFSTHLTYLLLFWLLAMAFCSTRMFKSWFERHFVPPDNSLATAFWSIKTFLILTLSSFFDLLSDNCVQRLFVPLGDFFLMIAFWSIWILDNYDGLLLHLPIRWMAFCSTRSIPYSMAFCSIYFS